MHYKTIMLALLKQHPALRRDLRNGRQWLSVLDRHAADLKTRHLAWIDVLRPLRPQSAPEQRGAWRKRSNLNASRSTMMKRLGRSYFRHCAGYSNQMTTASLTRPRSR